MSAVPEQGIVRFAEFELDLRSGELHTNGTSVRLQPQPAKILALLVRRRGETVTRNEIIEEVWGSDTFVDYEQGLNFAIRQIRNALGDDAERPLYVETLPKRGYRFVAPVAADVPAPSGPRSYGRIFWISSLACAALAVAALVLWSVSRIGPPPPKIINTVQLTSDGRDKSLFIATDGLRVYFSEYFHNGVRVMAVSVSGGQPVPIHTPFPDARLLNISPDMSELLVGEGEGEVPLWVVPILGGLPRRLGNVLAHDGSWSPNGQKFVYANGSALYMTNADGSEPRELVPAGSNPTVSAWRPTWSPDGNRLRFELYDGWVNHYRHTEANNAFRWYDVAALWEITAEGKDMHPLFPGWQDPPMQYCSSRTPEGRYYLFASAKNLVGSGSFPAPDIWTVREHGGWFRRPSGSPVQLTAGPLHFWCPISSLDGKVLFATSSSNRGELMHYDRKTQHLAPYLAGISAQGVSFSKDGAWMAYVTFPQGALWRSRTDGSESLQLTFAPLIVYDPHWSPDGKQIAYSGLNPGGQWQLYLVSRDGSTSQRLLPGSVVGIDSTWSPDGNSILFGQPPIHDSTAVHNVLQIFNVQTRRTSVVPGSDGLRSPRFSPNGKYISATSATDSRLMLFNVATQKWTEQGPKHAGWQSWSRDSKYVYFITIAWLDRTEFHPQRSAEPGIFRVAVNNNKLERILSLKGFRLAGTFGAWLSLTPDDDPLVLRDVGPPEIYALSWEAP